MVERDVFVVPTLTVIAMADGRSPGEEIIADPQLNKYLDDAQYPGLKSDFGGKIPGFSLAVAQHNVGALYAAGVDILAGSDAPNPGTAHGASVHQEMALLVESGMPAAAALRAAGATVADRFNLEDRGQLGTGARADVVLVEGDPLAEITATREIHSIFRNGFRVERNRSSTKTISAAVPAQRVSFESLDAPEGFIWGPTSDEMMGGNSTAQLNRVEPGADNSAGALAIDASILSGFPYPWPAHTSASASRGR